jgi:hypothetical protein
MSAGFETLEQPTSSKTIATRSQTVSRLNVTSLYLLMLYNVMLIQMSAHLDTALTEVARIRAITCFKDTVNTSFSTKVATLLLGSIIKRKLLFFYWHDDPTCARAFSFSRLHDHRHTTTDRTPLDELS